MRKYLPKYISPRPIAYLMFSLAGYTGFFWPRQSVQDAVNEPAILLFSIFFAIVATICLVGALVESWLIESIGLPGLGIVFIFIGAAIAVNVPDDITTISAMFANFGFGIYKFGRYFELRKLIEAEKEYRNGNGNSVY